MPNDVAPRTREATFCVTETDQWYHKTSVLHEQVRSRNEVLCQEYGHKETQLAKV